MQDSTDTERTFATCIFCGELLENRDVVKYRSWYAHKACTTRAMEKQVEDFDKKPFYAGSTSLFFGVITAGLFFQLFPFLGSLEDPSALIAINALMAVTLFLQSFGFFGFTMSFKDPYGIGSGIIALLAAAFFVLAGSNLQVHGYNPAYYDPETGFLILSMVPGYSLSYALAMSLTVLVMFAGAVLMMLYGDYIGTQSMNRIGVVFLFVGAVITVLVPGGILIEAISITALFLLVDIPKDWQSMTDV